MNLSPDDLKLLKKKGIPENVLNKQLETFKEGIPHVKVLDYAHIGKGIKQIDEKKSNFYSKAYEESNLKILKFIPASGAATRMFKALHQFLNQIEINNQAIINALETEKFALLKPLIQNINQLAFYNQALDLTKKQVENFEAYSQTEQAVLVLKTALSEEGLNLANLPKGLIPFHDYGNKIKTPFEEHLEEAKSYAVKNNQTHLHFTISEQHEENFRAALDQYLETENEQNTDFKVNFSHQKPSTDTIAVNMDNSPYRDENTQLFFRPGGHGALIYNLNDIDADLIFIKNIDNVSKKEQDKQDTTTYKKVLGGMLIHLQNQIFEYQKALENNPSDDLIEKVQAFMTESLLIKEPLETPNDLIDQLHKPIRICGMVKNDGAPGGGPFWIENKSGEKSLQIVETSQMDLKDKTQKQILDDATHFNPVDIVCGVKDYKGKKFDLLKYVNPKRGFVTQKSVAGQNIKALELPGLWNGAMEYWHSIFVEVPFSTFNPVKTVVDLLKPAHQDD